MKDLLKFDIRTVILFSILYGVMSWASSITPTSAGVNVVPRPAVALLLFTAFLAGGRPLQGFLIGFLGNIIADSIFWVQFGIPYGAPLTIYFRWAIGNGIMAVGGGLFANLLKPKYTSLFGMVGSLVVAAISIIAGMSYAAYAGDLFMCSDAASLPATCSRAIDVATATDTMWAAAGSNMLSLVLLPALLLVVDNTDEINILSLIRSRSSRSILLIMLSIALFSVIALGQSVTLLLVETGGVQTMAQAVGQVAVFGALIIVIAIVVAPLYVNSLTASLKGVVDRDAVAKAVNAGGVGSNLVKDLQIFVDEEKRDSQVAEITDSEFFTDLQQRATEMRGRNSRTRAND